MVELCIEGRIFQPNTCKCIGMLVIVISVVNTVALPLELHPAFAWRRDSNPQPTAAKYHQKDETTQPTLRPQPWIKEVFYFLSRLLVYYITSQSICQ